MPGGRVDGIRTLGRIVPDHNRRASAVSSANAPVPYGEDVVSGNRKLLHTRRRRRRRRGGGGRRDGEYVMYGGTTG